MEKSTLFHLLLVLLALSHIISVNAVPITRIGTLLHRSQVHQLPANTHLVTVEKRISEGESIKGRMFVELNDYPGSGANNRHTPRPQSGRCFDC